MFDDQEGSMGMRNQSPDVTAPVPALSDTPPPDADEPGSAPTAADLDAEFASQLDELSRCLDRMDAVVSMIEADLERRVATWHALAPEILSMLAAVVESGRQPKKSRRRVAAVMGEQARRGR